MSATRAWDLVLRGMMGATTYGTAAAISKGASYTIAGKTGTAQVFSVGQNEKYVEKNVAERLRDHAWFIAFAPAEAPRIAIAVLVENGGFGASAAAPIARKVMDAYLLHEHHHAGSRGQPCPRARPMIEDTGYARTRRTLSVDRATCCRRSISTARCWSGWGCWRSTALAMLYSASGQSVDTILRTLVRLALGTAAMLALTPCQPEFPAPPGTLDLRGRRAAAAGGRSHRRTSARGRSAGSTWASSASSPPRS